MSGDGQAGLTAAPLQLNSVAEEQAKKEAKALANSKDATVKSSSSASAVKDETKDRVKEASKSNNMKSFTRIDLPSLVVEAKLLASFCGETAILRKTTT